MGPSPCKTVATDIEHGADKGAAAAAIGAVGAVESMALQLPASGTAHGGSICRILRLEAAPLMQLSQPCEVAPGRQQQRRRKVPAIQQNVTETKSICEKALSWVEEGAIYHHGKIVGVTHGPGSGMEKRRTVMNCNGLCSNFCCKANPHASLPKSFFDACTNTVYISKTLTWPSRASVHSRRRENRCTSFRETT